MKGRERNAYGASEHMMVKDETNGSREMHPSSGAASGQGDLSNETDKPTVIQISLEQQKIDEIAERVPGGVANVQEIYPLSPLQEGVLFHHLLNETSDTYVLSTLFEFKTDADADALVHAIQSVIDRHDVLRSAVMWESLPHPIQVIHRKVVLPVDALVLERGQESEAQVIRLLKPTGRPIDLRKAPLAKLQMFADEDGRRWYAILRIHHIICDFQAWSVVISETMEFLRGRGDGLPALTAYREYVCWAQSNARSQEAEGYFTRKFGDVTETTAPFNLLDIHGDGRQMDEALESLDPALAQRVRAQASALGIRPARLFHAAWALVVARTSGRDDVVFGTVLMAAPPRRGGSDRMLGMFVNTLPLRIQLHEITASKLVEEIDTELGELRSFDQAPLTLARRCSGIEGTAPLFTSLLNYRRTRVGAEDVPQDATGVRVVARGEAWANYPVAAAVNDLGEGFELLAHTDPRIEAKRILSYFRTALESLVAALECSPAAIAIGLEVLPQEERRRLIHDFNAGGGRRTAERLIHQLFEDQVRRTPDAVAVVYNQESLTYLELNRRANGVARYLRALGIASDQLVALCVERSVDIAVGVLGVLKAGGAYLPLDPNYPREQLTYIIEDAAPKVILTQARLRASVQFSCTRVVLLDEEWGSIAAFDDTDLPQAEALPRANQLAYVIYTSGSTGRPKGVMIEHKDVLDFWRGLERLYRLAGPYQRVGLNASINFDASVQQIVQLLSGRTLVVIPLECRKDSAALQEYIEKQKIECIDCTPSQLRLWITSGVIRREGALRMVLVGGEAIETELWDALSRTVDTAFFNVYGPTECTVDATAARLHGEGIAPHIGRPIDGRRVYILGAHGQLLPVGVAGEIFIGGASVGRGYLNRPAQSAERFIADSFEEKAGARMYRTGDLGRWRADGSIEYLGRNDRQVKVRGFRIELGEIENQLLRHGQVSDALVMVREDAPGDRRLVGYVICRDTEPSFDLGALRAYLVAALPEQMIPSALVRVEQWPLTPSGKLDRASLPAPGLAAVISQTYEAPQGEVEEILAGVWQSLLRVENVGRYDSFFELGGHSLLVAQMTGQLRRRGLSVEVRKILANPRLADLASALVSAASDHISVPANLIPKECERVTPAMLPLVTLSEEQLERIMSLVPGGAANIQDIYPLTPIQEGILFHYLLNERKQDVYIFPILLAVESWQKVEELAAALQKVIDRHDVFRTAVVWEGVPQPVQIVCRRSILSVQELPLEPGQDAKEQLNVWATPGRSRLDIRKAPLVRLQAAERADGGCTVLLELHHIASDHVTLEILIDEVRCHLNGRVHAIAESEPFRNHVAQVLGHEKTREAEQFFREKLEDVREPTAPFGMLDVHGDGVHIDESHEDVDAALAQRIRKQARRYGVSSATIFHAAWGLVVSCTSGRHDVVFGTVLVGRLQGNRSVNRMLGMLINTLPLRLRLAGVSAKGLVEHVQRELVQLLHHEQTSLAVAQRCSELDSSAPLFTTLFNYRHSLPNADPQWTPGIRMIGIQERTNYPITVSVDDYGRAFSISEQTDRAVGAGRVTAYLRTAVESLVTALERAPTSAALSLAVIPEIERGSILRSFATGDCATVPDQGIHALFEDQVRRTPQALAVVCGDSTLNYDELNSKANQLARYLKGAGIEPGDLVGVCVGRRESMVIALLGALKSGAAYLPLDAGYPPARLQYMLQDAKPKIVLVGNNISTIQPTPGMRFIDIDLALIPPVEKVAIELPESGQRTAGMMPAYVLYTSGSTGTPKGVVMPHGPLVNLVEWHRRHLPLSEGERVLQFAALSFDVAFQEIFTTLCLGGALVLIDEWLRRDTHELIEVLQARSVNRMFVPPLMLQSLAETAAAVGKGALPMKDVITAGEQLRVTPAIRALFKSAAGCRLHNHYGPTETHVVTALTLSGDPDEWPAAPSIGRPIQNAQIHILGAYGLPAPVGVVGHVYVGGDCVSRGYLDRPELTADRFVCDPFGSTASGRLYKTGDLGLWQSDGTIRYAGRSDDQVKVRGYRIELQEIEAQLAKLPDIGEAAVIVREDVPGARQLVAYVTERGGRSLSIEVIRENLKKVLPAYMVPGAVVILESLPRTPSGKLDRRALPAPNISAFATGERELPEGNVEMEIAAIWQEVLRLERISRDDNFFDLGGHSLLAVRALSRMHQSGWRKLKLTDIYASPTIRELAISAEGRGRKDDFVDLGREAIVDTSIVATSGQRSVPARAILITGATGFVGRFLLAQLLQDTDATIYCLVRAERREDGFLRLRSTLVRWGLWREGAQNRIVAVCGDLRLPCLGIDAGTFHFLAREVDCIYHCGTSMNHLETYAMARPANVESARELLKFATNSKPKLINYISTMGVFGGRRLDALRVVNEDTSLDAERHLASNGYAASKWVSEKIFITAMEREIPCNIFRIGLVWADSKLGRYDELQRSYRFIKSVLLSGFGVRKYRHYSPPTPVDYVVRAVVFLGNRHSGGKGIFHIPTSRDMIDGIFERCNEMMEMSLQLLPAYEWTSKMKQLYASGRMLPIVPLIEPMFSMDEKAFYEYERSIEDGKVLIDCTRTREELERFGLTAPDFNDNVLRLCVERMCDEDSSLARPREHTDNESLAAVVGR